MGASTLQPGDITGEDPTEEPGSGRTLGLVSLVLLLAGMGMVAYRLYPEEHRQAVNPNFIDNIFASNLVIFIARVILLLGAGVLAAGMSFVVLSIWKRADAGHYLTRFGPFETEAIEDIRDEVETWQANWAEQSQKVIELNERIEESDALIAKLHGELREANTVIESLRDQASS
jgi:hypothetical protein